LTFQSRNGILRCRIWLAGPSITGLIWRGRHSGGEFANLSAQFSNLGPQADAARDQLELRQAEVRHQQSQNQVRLEVADAQVALLQARASYDAAMEPASFRNNPSIFFTNRSNRFTRSASVGRTARIELINPQ